MSYFEWMKNLENSPAQQSDEQEGLEVDQKLRQKMTATVQDILASKWYEASDKNLRVTCFTMALESIISRQMDSAVFQENGFKENGNGQEAI